MKRRDLIRQMRHEWRGNVWTLAVLTLGIAVTWIALVHLCRVLTIYCEPLGFDYDGVYHADIKTVNAESPEYTDFGDDTRARDISDEHTLIQRLRDMPEVEAAAFSANGTPFSRALYGIEIIAGTDSDDTLHVNVRSASPDIVRVLRLGSPAGTSPEKLEAAMRRGESLIGFADPGIRRPVRGLVLTNVYSGEQFTAGGEISHIKRYDMDAAEESTLLNPIDESLRDNFHRGLVFRIRPEMEAEFLRRLDSDPSLRRLGNVRITNVEPLSLMRSRANRSQFIQLRASEGIGAFFMTMIFLGLWGTFWFRITARRGEIAIRKTCGATRSDITRRFLGEASLLVLASLPMAAAAAYGILRTVPFLLSPNTSIRDYISAAVLTAVITELTVLCAVWIPARRAGKEALTVEN